MPPGVVKFQQVDDGRADVQLRVEAVSNVDRSRWEFVKAKQTLNAETSHGQLDFEVSASEELLDWNESYLLMDVRLMKRDAENKLRKLEEPKRVEATDPKTGKAKSTVAGSDVGK